MDVSLEKKPYMYKVNRGKRFEYAKNSREKSLDLWNKVLWSDESIFGSDGKVLV